MNRYTYRERLGRIYERVVGYNLADDAPSEPTSYIARTLREVMEEHVAAGEPAHGAD
jgi:hypothetical protein